MLPYGQPDYEIRFFLLVPSPNWISMLMLLFFIVGHHVGHLVGHLAYLHVIKIESREIVDGKFQWLAMLVTSSMSIRLLKSIQIYNKKSTKLKIVFAVVQFQILSFIFALWGAVEVGWKLSRKWTENCKRTDEAMKNIILNNKLLSPIIRVHFLHNVKIQTDQLYSPNFGQIYIITGHWWCWIHSLVQEW